MVNECKRETQTIHGPKQKSARREHLQAGGPALAVFSKSPQTGLPSNLILLLAWSQSGSYGRVEHQELNESSLLIKSGAG